MTSGTVVMQRELRRVDGAGFHVRVIAAARSAENAAALRRDVARWGQETADYTLRHAQRTLSRETLEHARFAVQVLVRAAAALTLPEGTGPGVLVAEHGDEVVGVAIFRLTGGRGYLDWLTVAPRYQVGSATPAAEQVAGIGSTLVCAAAARMALAGVTAVQIDPLDPEAERFWGGRGFRWNADDTHMVADGAEAATRLASACGTYEDRTAQGECIGCRVRMTGNSWRRFVRSRV
ncbi:MAG: hypothetical protein KGK07_16880 [Chloroflexota bacterium]|nr:hypothetical protein [Chloroflexota bacterium]